MSDVNRKISQSNVPLPKNKLTINRQYNPAEYFKLNKSELFSAKINSLRQENSVSIIVQQLRGDEKFGRDNFHLSKSKRSWLGFNPKIPEGSQKLLAAAYILVQQRAAFDKEGQFDYIHFKEYLKENGYSDIEKCITSRYFKDFQLEGFGKVCLAGKKYHFNLHLLLTPEYILQDQYAIFIKDKRLSLAKKAVKELCEDIKKEKPLRGRRKVELPEEVRNSERIEDNLRENKKSFKISFSKSGENYIFRIHDTKSSYGENGTQGSTKKMKVYNFFFELTKEQVDNMCNNTDSILNSVTFFQLPILSRQSHSIYQIDDHSDKPISTPIPAMKEELKKENFKSVIVFSPKSGVKTLMIGTPYVGRSVEDIFSSNPQEFHSLSYTTVFVQKFIEEAIAVNTKQKVYEPKIRNVGLLELKDRRDLKIKLFDTIAVDATRECMFHYQYEALKNALDDGAKAPRTNLENKWVQVEKARKKYIFENQNQLFWTHIIVSVQSLFKESLKHEKDKLKNSERFHNYFIQDEEPLFKKEYIKCLTNISQNLKFPTDQEFLEAFRVHINTKNPLIHRIDQAPTEALYD